MSERRVWLIPGASSGFGRALVDAALAHGDAVAAAARRPDQLTGLAGNEKVLVISLDTDEPPLRPVLGAGAIGNIGSRRETLGTELDSWRSLGEATAIGASA